MTEENIYNTPTSDLTQPVEANSEELIPYRKGMIPLWVKIFGWLFIVLSVFVITTAISALVTNSEAYYSLYGLEVNSHVTEFWAVFIISLFVAHAVCAYGLLFAKDWGVIACIILGYLSVAICLATTVFGSDSNIRLEILILIFYLLRLHKMKRHWFINSQID